MAFDLKAFARFTYRQLFKSRGTPYRLSPKRISLLLLFYTFFPLLELMTWLGFLLDDVFIREYRETEIEQAVFIVGNPRSGTTFLHRLLAQDEENFTSTQMWEVLIAPSITQRRVVQALGALDRRLGRPLDRLATACRRSWQEDNVMHKIALRAPEEDQYLFIHVWSTLAVWSFSAILDEARPYTYFDTEMCRADKERIMVFYRRCIQRHLYARAYDHERAKHYLSKNPSASPKVDTLYEFFPDAKIIYLARNPLDMIPSYISLLDFAWNALGAPVEAYGAREYVLEMALHWYTYPLQRLEQAPEESYVVVNFNDLVGDTERTVTGIYDRFGFEMTPRFSQVLREEAEKACEHASRHQYSLEKVGLTHERIVTQYGDVFDRFGFDSRTPSDEAE